MAFDPPSPEPPPSSSDDADLGTPGSSVRHPEPGSSAEVAIQIGQLDFSKPSSRSSVLELDEAPARSRGTGASRANWEFSWPLVIVGSYASAVTLALVWILATGKTLPRYRGDPSVAVADVETRPPTAGRAAEPVWSGRSVSLGKTLIIDDLEIMPLMILRKTIRLPETADADSRWGREIRGCLALTVRLKNASADRALTPLEPSIVWDGDLGEATYLEMGTGQRVSMLELSHENGEPIEERAFPTIAPGAVADVVILSEPVPSERLIGPLTWWISLKTGGDEMKTIGVRFSRREVDEVGG